MRTLLLVSLMACGGSEPGDSGSGATEPRFDAANWPTEIGGDRPAVVFAPADYDGTSELPVILMLHGYGVPGMIQDLIFQFALRVDDGEFILIVPEGTTDPGGAQFWNATEACCNFYESDVDDVGYLMGLLDEVEATMPVDADRITVVGHSNGGFMTYRLACEHSERFAGVASLAGMNTLDEAGCEASTPLSVLQVHGDQDETIPYEGDVYMPSAERSVAFWADKASCSGTQNGASADYLSDVSGTETRKQSWQGCQEGVEAELWTLQDGGHIPSFTETFRDDLTGWLLARKR